MACVERVWCFVELASSCLSARAQKCTFLYSPTHPCSVQDRRWRNRNNCPVPKLQPHGIHSGRTCRRESSAFKLQPHGIHLDRALRRECTVSKLQPHGIHLGSALHFLPSTLPRRPAGLLASTEGLKFLCPASEVTQLSQPLKRHNVENMLWLGDTTTVVSSFLLLLSRWRSARRRHSFGCLPDATRLVRLRDAR